MALLLAIPFFGGGGWLYLTFHGQSGGGPTGGLVAMPMLLGGCLIALGVIVVVLALAAYLSGKVPRRFGGSRED